jgi:Carbohydrate family 9 binding domain-like
MTRLLRWLGPAAVALILGVPGLLALLVSAPPVPPDTGYVPPRGYVCYRAPSAVTIDGDLTEPAWAAAAWSDDFVDIEGDAKPRPRFRTRMKMLWDDQGLYVAAELEEPHVWATLTQHDSVIFHDNDFEVFLDPDGDSHLYGELELNALNTTWDLLLTKPYKDGGQAINAWEITGLRTAVRVHGTLNDPSDTDRGWTVEIAWPWQGLKELTQRPAPPQNGDQWRINFSRVEWQHAVADGSYHKVEGRREDNWVWSPQGAINMHLPERWGVVQFSTAPPGTAVYRPDPGEPARRLLHRVYSAQRDYHLNHGAWAPSLSDLGLAGLPGVRLETTTHSFEASVDAPSLDGTTRRWTITSDARIWSE